MRYSYNFMYTPLPASVMCGAVINRTVLYMLQPIWYL